MACFEAVLPGEMPADWKAKAVACPWEFVGRQVRGNETRYLRPVRLTPWCLQKRIRTDGAGRRGWVVSGERTISLRLGRQRPGHVRCLCNENHPGRIGDTRAERS